MPSMFSNIKTHLLYSKMLNKCTKRTYTCCLKHTQTFHMYSISQNWLNYLELQFREYILSLSLYFPYAYNKPVQFKQTGKKDSIFLFLKKKQILNGICLTKMTFIITIIEEAEKNLTCLNFNNLP